MGYFLCMKEQGAVHTQMCTLFFSWGWVAKHFPTLKVILAFSTALLKIVFAWLPKPLQHTEKGLASTSVFVGTQTMFSPATALSFLPVEQYQCSSWASHKWDEPVFFWKSAKKQWIWCNYYVNTWSQCWPILHSFSIAVQRQHSWFCRCVTTCLCCNLNLSQSSPIADTLWGTVFFCIKFNVERLRQVATHWKMRLRTNI